MILGFKKQFKEPILNGIKIHTIREDKNRRWKPEMKIHFATGVRTKDYNQFKEGECISVQSICICAWLELVTIDDISLTDNETVLLARNDGFDGLVDFYDWFRQDFHGVLIHWTDIKY